MDSEEIKVGSRCSGARLPHAQLPVWEPRRRQSPGNCEKGMVAAKQLDKFILSFYLGACRSLRPNSFSIVSPS
jgi:hypothetical protein